MVFILKQTATAILFQLPPPLIRKLHETIRGKNLQLIFNIREHIQVAQSNIRDNN